MSPFPRWADLQPELLCRIGDHLDTKGYACARGACTAWRRALVPLSPTLLMFGADKDTRWCRRPYAASLPARRSLELAAFLSETRCVGASDGWLALAVVLPSPSTHALVVLLDPVAAVDILLPPLIYESRWTPNVSKVVFASCPAKDDFAAAAICDGDRIAYVTAGATRWAVMTPVRLTGEDHLVDVVYDDDGNAVYCLTNRGDVHVLRLPQRRRRRWKKPRAANDVESSEAAPLVPTEFSVLPPPQTAEAQGTTHLQRLGDQHILWLRSYGRLAQAPPESQGPDLNFPATIEPLLSEANLPFNPATAFAPPYDIVSSFTSAKNLVFCEGNLYQVWRNESCAVTLKLPGGGRRRLAEHEVVVLRYYPQRQPACWDVVKDLGGHSFFVGRNNAVSMYAEGVPGLKGNCVYWIGGRGRDQGMVFDMESRRSTPCSAAPPPTDGFLPGHPHSTICWYFL